MCSVQGQNSLKGLTQRGLTVLPGKSAGAIGQDKLSPGLGFSLDFGLALTLALRLNIG